MNKLDSRWYKEDRKAFKGDALVAQMKETEEALRNSTLLVRILSDILNEDLEKTFLVEEDFDNPAWERKTIAAAAERKVLRRIIKILP